MKKEEMLTEIYKISSFEFEELGFIPNKKKYIYTKTDAQFKFHFEIKISSSQRQHLTLSVRNNGFENFFHTVESICAREEKKSIEKEHVFICNLTDWKELYISNNKNIGEVWFKTFSNLEEIKESQNDYIFAIKLAMQWFEKCKNLDYVYHYNLNKRLTKAIKMALCIGKISGRDIQKEYNDFSIKNKDYLGWDKKQIDIFLDCLTTCDINLPVPTDLGFIDYEH